ncbi:hypothetical protein KFK09_019866 [Dendrobium nobile]|uniref:Integrase catalytic domain-containing protein n=1 Tax=Dendrobium nobile TaxID=94219 RepID=A0A8T3AS83_DENNO|nr:hypothetical protein KFK09_019866 [Dendrobium nobile]
MLYYVIFIDDHTIFSWIFPIRQKSEVLAIFENFKPYIENLTSSKIKCLRTDGGGEFVNNSFTRFLQQHGIAHQISCPYTPEQNGVAERKHRHIIETTRSLLLTASVPYIHWPDAVLTATYLINRMPSPNTNNISPFELLYHKAPEYDHLRIFGSARFPLIPENARHKLQPKAKLCVFLGYSENYKGYKCFDVSTNKLIISRHVKFDENCFPFSKLTSNTSTERTQLSPLFLTPTSVSQSKNQQAPTITSAQECSIPTPQNASHPHMTDSSSAQHQDNLSTHSQPPKHTHPMLTRSRTGSLKPTIRLNLIHKQQTQECPSDPTSYSEASRFAEWRQAMAAEFFALHKQGMWTLVPLPSNATVLGCRWTYRTKLHSDGSVAKHKARLVAKGNHQEYGLDYSETFSHVAKLPTIRILLAVALHHDWPVQQLDVANAFLHGSLSETIYMHQPKGFEDATNPNYVCRLHKAIYKLKQAPRQWHNTFTSFLISIGFVHCQSDPSLLIYRNSNIHIFLLIYVDDILITGNNSAKIQEIMNTRFAMKHLGTASSFLGIQIKRTNESFFLSQKPYANSILQMAKLQQCNSLSNPTCTKLPTEFTSDAIPDDPAIYRKIIGSLQYLCLTRPDISYSVNFLSQHMHQPKLQHVYLLKRLLRYIKGMLEYDLPITKSNLNLTSFSDADWASDPVSRKSTSGFCSFLGDTLISWTVKKQARVARSSTESEYRALASLTADVVWLRRILTDFGIPQTQPTSIYCDNTSAIALANNPVFHARTKHIEIDHRFVRDHILQQNIQILPIGTIDQVADIFTKSLSTSRFQMLRDKLTITRPSSVCGGVLEQQHTST